MSNQFEHLLRDVYFDGEGEQPTLAVLAKRTDDALFVESPNPDGWGVIIENQMGKIAIQIWSQDFQSDGDGPDLKVVIDFPDSPDPEFIKNHREEIYL